MHSHVRLSWRPRPHNWRGTAPEAAAHGEGESASRGWRAAAAATAASLLSIAGGADAAAAVARGAPHWLGMAWPQAILPALATRALVAALAHAGRLATTILLILFAPFARRWYRRCARAARADASAADLGAPRGARTPPAWLLSFVPCEPPSGSLGASLERSPLLLGSSGGSGTASGTASGSFSYGTRWDLDGVLAEGGEELGREDDLQLDALLASLACSDHSVLHEAVVACRRALGSTENAAEPPLQIERVLHAIEASFCIRRHTPFSPHFFFYSPTPPIFPICRTPFPPYVRN